MPTAHLHLIISARINNPPGPDDCQKVVDIMRGLVSHVRMEILRDATALWCDKPGNEGITADVLLTTSNSVIHIWNHDDGPSRLEFDLFSCAPFSPQEVFDYLCQHFDIVSAGYKFLDREHGLTELEAGSLNEVS